MIPTEIVSSLQKALSASPIAILHSTLKTLEPHTNIPKGRKRLESKIIQIINERYEIYGIDYVKERIRRLGK